MVRDIVIVGGGTAGWLTAAVLAAGRPGVRVTVVESPDVPIIGVGEGTWPTMRDTLRRIGVSESDFLRECDASFKQGSRFDRWSSGLAGDRYYHPFVLPHGYTQADLASAWLAGPREVAFAEVVSVQPYLCAQGKAPKQPATPEFAAVANYAYHLDAGKFATFLRRHCTTRLGVVHVEAHVTEVLAHANGDIAALALREGSTVPGDLFIDCSGMQSLLLGAHYGVAVRGVQHVLFNDSALAVQIPYADPEQEIESQTLSTAQVAGWIWDIGLPTRRGIGHVYSSAHTSDAEAERALRDYVSASGGPADMPTPRKLSFSPGYRERFWHRNCVAVGLSAGFVEPLEASAIVMVELSATLLCEDLPATREDMDIVAARFNDSFAYRWERVIEFLKLHYALSRRPGDYWRDNRDHASWPGRLAELLALWAHRPPNRHDFTRAEEIFPSASHQYILYGMGFMPATPRVQHPTSAAEGYFRETRAMAGRMLSGLPGNRALLAHVARHGLPRI